VAPNTLAQAQDTPATLSFTVSNSAWNGWSALVSSSIQRVPAPWNRMVTSSPCRLKSYAADRALNARPADSSSPFLGSDKITIAAFIGFSLFVIIDRLVYIDNLMRLLAKGYGTSCGLVEGRGELDRTV